MGHSVRGTRRGLDVIFAFEKDDVITNISFRLRQIEHTVVTQQKKAAWCLSCPENDQRRLLTLANAPAQELAPR